MITTAQVKELYDSQLNVWPDFRKRVEQLKEIELRTFDFGKYQIKTQFNPARAVSSNAKLDKASIANRKCFLCKENRPAVQKGVAINDRFTLLVNPFPIMEEHFTIPLNQHSDQEIKPYIEDLLDFSHIMEQHVLLYNGPHCGASAPDHIHFQAVRKGQLPFENEWQNLDTKILSECKFGKTEEIQDFGRRCIHIEATDKVSAKSFFLQIYTQYQMREGMQDEPKMNIFSLFEEKKWHLFIFPRKTHRPTQFYAEGTDYKMISPGAIDIAGILVLPRREDFDQLDKETIIDVFKQVSL